MTRRTLLTGLLVLAMFSSLVLCGCSPTSDGGSTPTKPGSTTAAASKVTPTQTATVVPTPADPTPTPEPLPTIQPGTEQYAEGFASETEGIKAYFCENGEGGAGQQPMKNTDTMAVQFFPTTTFEKVGVHCPTWTNLEGHILYMELYAWAGSYTATLATLPVADGEFSDWEDGTEVVLEFDPLPDGEYLLLLMTDGVQTGVWYQPKEHPSQRAYQSDNVWDDASIRMAVYYTKTPNKLYGPLSDSGIE